MEKASAQYKINFYELDVPIAVNFKGKWPAMLQEGRIHMNVIDDDAVLLEGTILSISHPMLGNIRGLYPKGLDYTIVLEDGRKMSIEAEEIPGRVHELNKDLDPEYLDVNLWRPYLTEIPYNFAYAGLFRDELKYLWSERDKKIRKLLEIREQLKIRNR